MNIEVCRKWYAQGVREFGQPAQHISLGAFLFLTSVLEGIANQMGTKHTAPLDCEALLVDLQTRLNRLSEPHLFFTIPGAAIPSQPSSAVSSLPSSVPPTSLTVLSQPSASSSYAVPPPLQPQPALSRKRRSQDVNDKPQKRRRGSSQDLFASSSSCSSVEPDSPVHRPRPRPRPRRKLIDIDEANCVQNRTRAARTPTELYQEPEEANWGRNGTEANAIAGFLPLRRPLRPQMSTCTICYCQLTHSVDNTTSPALCVNCGRYKSRNVSIICMRHNKRYIFYSYK